MSKSKHDLCLSVCFGHFVHLVMKESASIIRLEYILDSNF